MDPSLEKALLAGLDALSSALDLRQLEPGRFHADPDMDRPIGHVYGGQLLAQAVVAAGRTVDGKPPSSLHALFVRAGRGGLPLELEVEPVRDGRSMSTRRVTVLESGAPLLTALVSFHDGGTTPEMAIPAPPAPPPEEVPLLQDWAGALPAHLAEHGRHWIETPPPIEFRLPTAPSFLGGSISGTTRAHWMRAPREVGPESLLHCALLAYASDFFLMDMVFHAAPDPGGPGRANGLSLDHAIWFHRPVQIDRWHLYSQEAVAATGRRGLARGTIHDSDGQLAATVMQEILLLPPAAP